MYHLFQVSIFGAKVTYFKKPDYLKPKTYEEKKVINKDSEFNKVFGTKKSLRYFNSKNNEIINTSTNILNNISTCMF